MLVKRESSFAVAHPNAGTIFAQPRLLTEPDLFSAQRKTEHGWLLVCYWV